MMRKSILALFSLVFCVGAQAKTLRCANVPSSSLKTAFEMTDFVEGEALILAINRPGVLIGSDIIDLEFRGKNRSGYARYSGTTNNPTYPVASLWLNTSYANERNLFPGELTLKGSAIIPIPLICSLTQR